MMDTPTLEQQLEEILSKNPSKLINYQNVLFTEKISQCGERYILFGSGNLGRNTLAGLRKAGIAPLAFADNNPKIWNTIVDGLVVLSPQDAAQRYSRDAVFVITVYTSQPVWEQLTSIGLNVVSFAELAWRYADFLIPYWGVAYPYKIFEQLDNVKKAFSIWADETSCREYIGQLRWQTSLDRLTLPPHLPQKEIYFADDIIARNPEEVFVDCGAFDGDSIQEFINRNGASFQKIIAIEPDPVNCKALEARILKLPPATRGRIQIIQNATGSKKSVATFNATGTVGSAIGTGNDQVKVAPMDELLASLHPTYIKLDIEGAEPDALLGTIKIIANDAPVLAICLYHSQEHLWQIPLLIQSLNNNYKLFLRRYADECWETVCYAVPLKRLAN
jgi:FkbM family methyltransferase